MTKELFASCATMAMALAAATPAVAQEQVTENGSLSTSDRQISSGEYADSYEFYGEAGQAVDISAQSNEFDTYLIVNGPEGARFENDDEDGSINARIIERLPATGVYQVIVTSYAPGETGRYTLTVRPRQEGDGMAMGSGLRENGSLSASDERISSGEYADAYEFYGEAGQRADISAQSNEFDTYLIVNGPEGARFENDDSEGVNARVTEALPATGIYQVIVTSYAPGETGNYTLTADLD